MRRLLSLHPLLLVIASAVGVYLLQLAKQFITTIEQPWFIIIGVLIIHFCKLILIALGIAAVIITIRKPNNEQTNTE